VYLHWGYEVEWLSAHNPIINTSFQHYAHHAKSIIFKPYHCGFMFKCWDQLFGCVYDGKCFCAHCAREQGLRTRAHFEKVEIPDYSVLLEPSFWLQKGVWSGLTSKDQNSELTKGEREAAGVPNQKPTLE
jgi:hypothetical protein